MIPLVVVSGPTACGKTKLSIDLAKRFGGEVVSADSMQIYKDMDIGTAKPTAEETGDIPHHLIDFLEPDEAFSVAQYVTLAGARIKEIGARGKLPVLAGGTGLYISSLVDNIQFQDIKSDPKLREELYALEDKRGSGYLWRQLNEIDPALSEKLHPNNLGRIVRAIEVYRLTGRTMSALQEESRSKPSEYRLCMLGICYNNRETLYKRIDARVDMMLEQGLVGEARNLFDRGFSKTAAQAIGYKELFRYFGGEEPLELAIENIKRETRRYAKRQMTWLRRDGRVRWLAADGFESYGAFLEAAARVVITDLGIQ